MDIAKARLDVVQRLSNEEPNVTAGALELADEPQPRKEHARPTRTPYLADDATAVGRYKFYQKERDVPTMHGLLLDTATGRCWVLNGLAWTDVANPTGTKLRSPLDPPDSLPVPPEPGLNPKPMKSDPPVPMRGDEKPARPKPNDVDATVPRRR